MRLLDRIICQTPTARLTARDTHGALHPLPSACDHALELRQTTLRLVLSDDLVTAASTLAFAEGERLRSCLDLVRVPAERLWIEWNDRARVDLRETNRSNGLEDPHFERRRGGLLLRAAPDGLSAMIRTFWADSDAAAPRVAAVCTELDLTASHGAPPPLAAAFDGAAIRVADPEDEAIDALFDCLRFRFDTAWCSYYRANTPGPLRPAVLQANLSAVARDAPMVMGIFLLLNARDATRARCIERGKLNRARLRRGEPALLDHVEVDLQLQRLYAPDYLTTNTAGRNAPRLHHVRGHIVRRARTVFWRTPHLRGKAAFGRTGSRTVRLSL
jgi:hypothetical protein